MLNGLYDIGLCTFNMSNHNAKVNRNFFFLSLFDFLTHPNQVNAITSTEFTKQKVHMSSTTDKPVFNQSTPVTFPQTHTHTVFVFILALSCLFAFFSPRNALFPRKIKHTKTNIVLICTNAYECNFVELYENRLNLNSSFWNFVFSLFCCFVFGRNNQN